MQGCEFQDREEQELGLGLRGGATERHVDEGVCHFTCTPRPKRKGKGVPSRGNGEHKGSVLGNLGGFLSAAEDVCQEVGWWGSQGWRTGSRR